MIVMNRKRISVILLLILTGIFSFAYQSAKNEFEDTQYVVTTPVSNKVVIIDAGHGTPDEGAQSNNGTTEAEINLKIALKVQQILEQSGCTVILTRSDENAMYEINSKTLREKKIDDSKNRAKLGNTSSADIFVSIHVNKISETKYSGWQTFYKKSQENGKLLATDIQDALNSTINKNNNRLPKQIDNVYIVKEVEIPIALVECGFLSNENELNLLLTDDYQEKLAWGIFVGINNYFNR